MFKNNKKDQFKEVDPIKDALKVIENGEKVEKKFLNKQEFYDLQLFHAEYEAQKHKVINKKLILKIGEFERTILEYKIKEKINYSINVNRDLEKHENILKTFKDRHKEVLGPIRTRLDLPEKFGYDEHTFEIKTT